MKAIAIGIDFGSANVRVGRWNDGRFEKITEKSGADAFPAFFGRKDKHNVFGQEARAMSTVEPANVIFNVLQFAGLDHKDALYKIAQGMYPFKIGKVDHNHREFDFQLHNGSTVSPFEVIQCFLEHLRMQCEELFGLQEFSLAFTGSYYPYLEFWNCRETELLKAAQHSGFTRVSLIDNQVAATFGYYLTMKNSETWLKNILVVDVGANDITATVTRTRLQDETKDETETETFTVIGKDFGCTSVNRALMRYLKDRFVNEHKLPLKTIIEMKSWHLLRMECEKAIISLTTALTTVLFVPNFTVGYDLHVELTRDTFDNVAGLTIAEDVIGITEQVLALSKINVELSTKNDFRLLLVGGGSRIPCIRQRMDTKFGSKTNSAALLYSEDAAVVGAAGFAQIVVLEPDVVKLDVVQHYRDLCDFFHNNGMPWEEYGTARLACCRSPCTHASAKRTVVFFDRITSILPSIHGISAKTDGVSYRFSIKNVVPDYFPSYVANFLLHNVDVTQATAASLQLQQRHMCLLSLKGALEQDDLTGSSAFCNLQGRMSKIRNPLGLCHPNVVRCLAVGRTPMREDQDHPINVRGHLEQKDKRQSWPVTENFTCMLLDMQLDRLDRFHDHPFLSSGWDITLHRFCKERGSSLGSKEIITKTKQLLHGLSYLHSQEIPFILASLTSFGILVTPDGETVKIWDILFGLVDKSPSQLHFNISSCFTNDLLAYAHPEVSNYILDVSRDYEKCSTFTLQPYMDIWSLGCVVLDMASGGHDFILIDRHGVLLDKRIRRQDFIRTMAEGGIPLIPSSASDIIRQVCTYCFKRKSDRQADALLEMISQIPEDKIDVCTRNKASFKQTAMSLFAVRERWDSDKSNNIFFEFSYGHILGRGSYGDVYVVNVPKNYIVESSVHNDFPEAVDNEERSGKKLALKILINCKLAERVERNLMQLGHDHVVKYISTGTVSTGPGKIPFCNPETGILMEHYTGGNLNTLAKEQALSAVQIVDYARQIASGLAYLHSEIVENDYYKASIIHGDLKGENIFLTSETRGTAKIGDIDSSGILEMARTNKSGARIKQGTFTHMSPEMLAFAYGDEEDTTSVSTNIGRATDIYSVGCIILEMFGRGVVSYSKKDGSKVEPQANFRFAKSVSLDVHPDLSVTNDKNIPSNFLQLLKHCIQREPQKRPKAEDFLEALTKMWSKFPAI